MEDIEEKRTRDDVLDDITDFTDYVVDLYTKFDEKQIPLPEFIDFVRNNSDYFQKLVRELNNY